MSAAVDLVSYAVVLMACTLVLTGCFGGSSCPVASQVEYTDDLLTDGGLALDINCTQTPPVTSELIWSCHCQYLPDVIAWVQTIVDNCDGEVQGQAEADLQTFQTQLQQSQDNGCGQDNCPVDSQAQYFDDQLTDGGLALDINCTQTPPVTTEGIHACHCQYLPDVIAWTQTIVDNCDGEILGQAQGDLNNFQDQLAQAQNANCGNSTCPVASQSEYFDDQLTDGGLALDINCTQTPPVTTEGIHACHCQYLPPVIAWTQTIIDNCDGEIKGQAEVDQADWQAQLQQAQDANCGNTSVAYVV